MGATVVDVCAEEDYLARYGARPCRTVVGEGRVGFGWHLRASAATDIEPQRSGGAELGVSSQICDGDVLVSQGEHRVKWFRCHVHQLDCKKELIGVAEMVTSLAGPRRSSERRGEVQR